ncbi:MAG TPA: type I restriction endonuclease subunit R [Bacillales bacterium]|nr:type I restriction endonuclease subunit R [Bacillales bacterium]
MTTANWSEEEEVENRLIRQLKNLGYKHVQGSGLDNERDSLRDVILKSRLESAVRRINPWIGDSALHQAVRSVTHIEGKDVMEANESFHTNLVSYLSISQDLGKGKKNQTVKLIDFDDVENNEFLVVNQLRVTGTPDHIIPDVVLFVNGMPLVVIECKSPAVKEPIYKGYAQLDRYRRQAERLFYYNQILVSTCGRKAKYGTIGSQLRHFSEWKDPWPLAVHEVTKTKHAQEIMVAGMLTKRHLLDLVQNFIVFEPEGGRTVKKLARYQQFRAVNKAIRRIETAEDPKERGGVVWHTQGSGKSLTMMYLSLKLRRTRELRNPTILIVTDRTDLDRQITSTFKRCGFPNPQQAKSVSKLRELLRNPAGKTVMTTLQKFQNEEGEDGYPEMSRANNIFILVDEAHRSQYKDLALNMRSALPNACYLGFTGTPIDKKDKSTRRTFGDYIDKYTIEQAVEDGATVKILYESRLPDLHVMGESLDDIFNRVFADYPEKDRDRIKKRFANEEAVTSAPQRIEQVALDIIHHYERHIQPNGMKGQIVAVNRETAVRYKEMLDRFHAPESAVVISGSNEDNPLLRKYHLTREQEKEVIARFKNSEDPLSFLIVVDRLLTGFDAPIEQVMYLDKPLKEHRLLQAIARTNRTYDKKTYGLLVDYYGVSNDLTEALEIFSADDVKGALTPIDSEIPRLQSRHRAAMRFFDHVDKSNLDACVLKLEPEDVRVAFNEAYKKFAESMDLVMPDPAANPYLKDLKFLSRVRLAAKNDFADEELDISGCGEKVKQIIEEHIRVSDITLLHEPVSIFADHFRDVVEAKSSDEAKASKMEHAIRKEIRVKMDEDPVYYQSLKEKLEGLIAARKEARMSALETLEQYQHMVNDMKAYHEKGEEIGVSKEAYPFFQLLKEAMDTEDESVADLTDMLVEEIKKHAGVVEWTKKEDVKRQMRRKIKKQLRASGCPKEKLEEMTQKLTDLAQVHFG